VLYAQVQAFQGNYKEALDIFESVSTNPDSSANLMAHFFAISGKTVTLLRLGQFGEVLRIVKAGRERAAKNGNDPWLFDLREAWLRMLALDFEGSRRICETILSTKSDSPPKTTPRVARGYARVAVGYAALDDHEYELAIGHFRQTRDPNVTPKFFLHWMWRMMAQLGLSDTWLHMGNTSKASHEADGFLESALSSADPHLQALAWEMKTRVAEAEKDRANASKFIERALEIVEKFGVPVAAWQVHSTAWRFYQHANKNSKAEAHRACSEQSIFQIANSFARDEPLRAKFLSAKPVAEILGAATRKPAAQVGD